MIDNKDKLENKDKLYLLQALDLAQIRRGFCAPNPSVGAVITLNDQVQATGYHTAAGQPHAEIEALKKTNAQEGATIYITLEPCCHHGKTPPCTDALIKAKIKRVVYAYSDPNPLVAGKGEAALSQAGIECIHLPLPEIDAFYKSYHYWHQTKRPFITAKIAMTLDNKIATRNNEPIPITGQALNQFTHQNRKSADAILTTAKTIISDNPQLNARIQDTTIAKPLYILDSHLTVPHTAQVFTTAKSITIFHAEDATKDTTKNHISQPKINYIKINLTPSNQLDLNQIIKHIGQDGIHDLWIEAGAQCFNAFLQQHLLQRALIYIAPWIYGAEGINAFPEKPLDLRNHQIQWKQFGSDVLCDINW